MQPAPANGTCDRCASRGKRTTARTPHHARWVLPVALLVGSLLLLSPAGAQAQPPNDDRTDATIIPSLPFTDAVDTTDATTAPDDPDCAGNGPTVWYEFTPDATGWVFADTSGSDYDTTLSIYVEEAGGLTQLACQDDFFDEVDGEFEPQARVRFEATAGTTYFLMVGSSASGLGGRLTLTATETEAPLVFDVALSPNSSVAPKTGLVTVRGTVRCNTPAFYFIGGILEQRQGRIFIRADFYAEGLECTPPQTAWSAPTSNATGLFTGGKATVSSVFASACNSWSCADVFIEEPVTIQLTGKGKP
jgi:hypothetical protein